MTPAERAIKNLTLAESNGASEQEPEVEETE
jgi:hypothetical protein